MFESIYGDFIKIAVNLVLTAIIISGINLCMYLSDAYHEKAIENAAVAGQIKEERLNIFYNHTHVYQQDVVSMIMKYKGDKEIIVKLHEDGDNIPDVVYKWNKDEQATDYKASAISDLLPKDVLYDADLIVFPHIEGVVEYDGTIQQVVGYTFVSHRDGCGR